MFGEKQHRKVLTLVVMQAGQLTNIATVGRYVLMFELLCNQPYAVKITDNQNRQIRKRLKGGEYVFLTGAEGQSVTLKQGKI